jgi:hypothetical protein
MGNVEIPDIFQLMRNSASSSFLINHFNIYLPGKMLNTV